MENQTAYDYLAMFIAVAALAVGLISMAVGKIQALIGRRPTTRQPITTTTTTRRARRALPIHRVMSRQAARVVALHSNGLAVSAAKHTNETAETPQPVAENSGETFSFGETQALARLVVAGKIGLTDAVKIGADAKSGEKYQKRSQEIKAAVAALQKKYPDLTPDRQQILKQTSALN